MRKTLVISLVFIALNAALFSQQITKFAVVDTSKVYNSYFRSSAPIRNYEKKKEDFQKEVDKYTKELQDLQAKKLDSQKQGKDAEALKYDSLITKKKDFLIEYTNAKNIELESIRRSLQASDDFYKKLYDTLAKIAEAGGYSMVLSLQQDNAILWYSPSVDITDKVIADLGL